MTTTPTTDDRATRPAGETMLAARLITALASLRLTVTLFALSIFLVFAGTLAQVEYGIWQIMDRYFRCVVAWIDVGPLTFGLVDTDLALPYPGGWLLGGVLLGNLLAAHALRFDVKWKRSGLLLIHTGLIALMLSELVTGLLADETQISFLEGQTTNFAEDIREFELAVIDTGDPAYDTVWAIPESRLRVGATVTEPGMPFGIEVVDVYPNHTIAQGAIVEQEESPGVSSREPVDLAASFVYLVTADGRQKSDKLSLSQHQHRGVSVNFAGRDYRVVLRFRRVYKPFAMTLLEFTHDKYLGTEIPRNFASTVRLMDPANREDRTHTISMNQPLRYRGETFYQHQVVGADEGSVLQVVRNPGWLIPYISCAMMGLGLVIHFCVSLVRFGRRGVNR